MKKLNQRETLILIVTVFLFVLFMAYQFVLKPVQEGALDVNARLRSVHHELLKAKAMVAQKAAVNARYRNLVDRIGVVDSDEAQMPAIISNIETAARENNIHIGNIQPQKSITQKEAVFLAVELEIDGQWLDVVKFLYALQQSNSYFVNELNLEKYSDTTDSLRGRIVISRMCLINP